jgi:hypothetical protein
VIAGKTVCNASNDRRRAINAWSRRQRTLLRLMLQSPRLGPRHDRDMDVPGTDEHLASRNGGRSTPRVHPKV